MDRFKFLTVLALLIVAVALGSYLIGFIHADSMATAQAQSKDKDRLLTKDYMKAVVEIRQEIQWIRGSLSPRASYGLPKMMYELKEAVRENTAAMKKRKYKPGPDPTKDPGSADVGGWAKKRG